MTVENYKARLSELDAKEGDLRKQWHEADALIRRAETLAHIIFAIFALIAVAILSAFWMSLPQASSNVTGTGRPIRPPFYLVLAVAIPVALTLYAALHQVVIMMLMGDRARPSWIEPQLELVLREKSEVEEQLVQILTTVEEPFFTREQQILGFRKREGFLYYWDTSRRKWLRSTKGFSSLEKISVEKVSTTYPEAHTAWFESGNTLTPNR